MIYTVKRDENISQTVGFVAPNNVVDLWTFVVPQKSVVRLLKFGNYIDLVAAWGAITWSIMRNGIADSRYGAILDQLGTSYQPQEIYMDDFHGGDTITIRVTNAHIANVDIGIRIVGELEERE